MNARLHQFGAIPVRAAHGPASILLVTSRGSGRWIIPEGWQVRGLTPAESAAREAYEEAGVRGTIAGGTIGRFDAKKRGMTLGVGVFVLRVEHVLANWPEMRERERGWFTPEAAALAVREAALGALFERAAAMMPEAAD